MDSQTIIIEKIIDAPSDKVWSAITNKEEMKEWYFDLKEFKPEPGFEFSFNGGTETKTYLHHCKIKKVLALCPSWFFVFVVMHYIYG